MGIYVRPFSIASTAASPTFRFTFSTVSSTADFLVMGVVLRKRAGVVRVRGRRVEREMRRNDMVAIELL